jgi:hypothetical protein
MTRFVMNHLDNSHQEAHEGHVKLIEHFRRNESE